MVKWITILLAVLGLSMGIWTVATSSMEAPSPVPARAPSINPFANGIASSGLVEAQSTNIAVASPEAGQVASVYVQVNQSVKKGAPLFELDGKMIEAAMVRAEAALTVAKVDLARLKAQPRAEDLPPLRAKVEQARIDVEVAKDEYILSANMNKSGAATDWEVRRKRLMMERAKANLDAERANLKRVQVGAWEQDIKAALARVNEAQAELKAILIQADRLIIRSPIDGVVLKRYVEPGEYTSGNLTESAMIIGDMTVLRVRAQVDEEDSTLLHPGAKAIARLRGASLQEFNLKMLYIEPMAQPKSQLKNSVTERIDTRVIDVLFEVVQDENAALYPGQLVDVFIEGAPQPITTQQQQQQDQDHTNPE